MAARHTMIQEPLEWEVAALAKSTDPQEVWRRRDVEERLQDRGDELADGLHRYVQTLCVALEGTEPVVETISRDQLVGLWSGFIATALEARALLNGEEA
jgi:hypothetical protein